MVQVRPIPSGTVPDLVGTPLRADVSAPGGEAPVAYEVELVQGRRGPRSRAWAEPLWRHDSREPQFVTVDGHHAFQGMLASRRRPIVRMESAHAIDAFDWVLRQDGRVIDRGVDVGEGLSADGRSFTFRPERHLRRSGEKARPRDDVFYPPFDSHLPNLPRSEDSRVRYAALTHAGHDEQDDYAVDFNWGSGSADRGHWVLASAPGRVTRIDPANGQVHVSHAGADGDRVDETIYAHLDPILVREGDKVKALQRLGRIGSVYHDDVTISPHLHYQQLRDGEPVKMRLLVHGEEIPIGVSRRNPGRTIIWDRRVPGWIRPRGPAPARLLVRARHAEDGGWTAWNDLRFVIAHRKGAVPDDQDDRFHPGPASAPIEVVYDGPAVDPGDYTIRYRALQEGDAATPWAYDVVTVEPVLA